MRSWGSCCVRRNMPVPRLQDETFMKCNKGSVGVCAGFRVQIFVSRSEDKPQLPVAQIREWYAGLEGFGIQDYIRGI